MAECLIIGYHMDNLTPATKLHESMNSTGTTAFNIVSSKKKSSVVGVKLTALHR